MDAFVLNNIIIMKNKFYLLVISLLLIPIIGFSQATLLNLPFSPNGTVYCQKQVGNTLYVGGNFTSVDVNSGSLVGINLANPNVTVPMPKVNGLIYTIVSDGTGGFFIGGSFTTVGGLPRKNFARITSTMSVHSMDLGFDNIVKKIVTHNGKAYVVGNFNNAVVNNVNQPRSRIACINIATNTLNAWTGMLTNPIINDAVIINNKLYIGGKIMYSGTNRALLAYNLSLTNPTIISTGIQNILQGGTTNNAIITSLVATSNNQLYFGGTFDKVTGQNRTNVAGIDAISSALISTNMVLNNTVNSLAWYNNVLYVAGYFTTVNGGSKPRLFAYNTSSNSLFTWTPNPNSTVSKIGVQGGSLWVSGNFTNISTSPKTNFAVYTLSTSIFTSPVLNNTINLSPNHTVQDILGINPTTWVAGGFFSQISVGGAKGVMAIDLLTNSIKNFAPQVTGTVKSIDVYGSNVLLGGTITNVNGTPVQNFAMVNSSNGSLNTTYKANFNGSVNSILVSGTRVFLGGGFSNVTVYNGGTPTAYPKTGIISLNFSSSSFTNNVSFNPTFTNSSSQVNINVLKIINGLLYVGGSFTSPRNGLVCLNQSNGVVNSGFNANLTTTAKVNDLIFTPLHGLAIGGYIPNVNGNLTYNLAYINVNSGAYLRSNYTTPSTITSNEVMSLTNGNNDDVMYVTAVGLLRTQNATGASTVAHVQSGNKYTIAKIGTNYFIGGGFTYYNPSLANTFKNFMGLSFISSPPPTLASSNLTFTNVSTNSMSLNWTIGGGQNRIVLMKPGLPITSHPTDFTNYTASNTYGSGSNIGGAFVVYNSNGNNTSVTNLQPGVTYYVKIIEYNGTGATLSYGSNSLLGQQTTQNILTPSLAATNIQAYTITKNSMYLYCTPGNGVGRLIVARQGSPVNVTPQINHAYIGSSVFGSGDDLGQGNFVISSGSAFAAYLSNLQPGTTYHFAVFEFNSNGNYITRYKTNTFPTANFSTLANAPEPVIPSSNLQVQNLGGGSINVTWNSGGGGNRILMVNQVPINNITSVGTVDGDTYLANSTLNNYSPNPSTIDVMGDYQYFEHKVVYNGSGNQVTLYGFNSSTTYNFILVDYNSLGVGTENYLQNLWAATNFTMPALVNAPNLPATNLKVEAASHNAARISWTNGNGSNRILVAKQGSPVNWVPTLNSSYSANSSFGSGTNYSSHFIVYNGSGNTANVTNLQPYTDYHFAVYEYNSAYNSYTFQNEVKYNNLGAFGTGKTQPANWPRIAGGTGTDAAGGVTTDAAGNVYVAGTYNGTANFGLTQVTGTSNQIFLSKYNSAGILQWIKTAGGGGEDAASCVTVDNAGNSYIVGSFRNTAMFDTIFVTSNGIDDAFIAKYNSQGAIQWVKTMGGTDQDVAFWAKVDGNGDIAVTGYFHGSPTFSNSSQTLTSSGNSDIWVAKYGTNGNLIWSIGAGGNSYDYGHCLTIGANNSIIISGEYKTTANFGSNSLTNSGNESNAFIAKLSNSGGWQWAKEMGGTGTDAAYGVTVDATDNYYVVGSFSNIGTFGTDNLTSAGLTDAFISRVNSNGTFQWTSKFGGVSKDMAGGVSIASNGTVYVSGSFANSMSMNGTILQASGNQDIVVATYTQTGLLSQATKFGGNQNDQARAIHAVDNTTTYLCGYFEGTAVFGGFEVNASNATNSSQFTGDMFVHNIASIYNPNPTGDLIAWFKFNGNHNDFSGNNFNGTPMNSPVFVNDRVNTSNSAFGTNGSGYLNFSTTGAPQFDNLSEVTYSGWVKYSPTMANFYQFLMLGTNATSGYATNMLYLDNLGKVYFYLYNPSSTYSCIIESPDYTVPSNTWTHISATYKAGNFVRLYVNGSLISGNVTNQYTSDIVSLNNGNFNIASYISSGFQYYPLVGSMDDVRLYKRALNQAEIIDIMNATPLNSSPPMEQTNGKVLIENQSVLYPNPNNGNFNLSFTVEDEKELSFRIIDLTGKVIYEDLEQPFKPGFQIKSFDLTNIHNGCYTLQVIENNRIIANHKIIVNQ
jgi:hypothetical protein